MENILAALNAAAISLKLKKCEFFSEKVKYLGHILRPGKLKISKTRIAALEIAEPQRDPSELRSFLGLCNVCRRLIPQFAETAAPLEVLFEKGAPVKLARFRRLEMEAFASLISAATTAPILALRWNGPPYSIAIDASASMVGAALFQRHEDGQRHPVGYFLRSLTNAEKNYSTSKL